MERLQRLEDAPEAEPNTPSVTETEKALPLVRSGGIRQLPGWDDGHEKPVHGRPTLYTPELAAEICATLSESTSSLAQICRENVRFPSERTMHRWIAKKGEFCHLYAREREAQADFLLDQILEIVDDDSLPINRAKVMVDTRKWLIVKLCPHKYGDR